MTVCPMCLDFYDRKSNMACPLHPRASHFWLDQRPGEPGMPLEEYRAWRSRWLEENYIAMAYDYWRRISRQ
jgi:hypothetical protein